MRISNDEFKEILEARYLAEHYILDVLNNDPQADDLLDLGAALENLHRIQDILIDNLLNRT